VFVLKFISISLLIFFSYEVFGEKKFPFQKKIITLFLLSELEKKVQERDKHISYAPSTEVKTNCEKTIILEKEMPWDSAGLYPVLFKDIRVLCKKKEDKILFAIGDSMTGGPGVLSDETYPSLLTKKFQNTIVVNAGINGSNTFHWRKEGVLFDRIIRQNKDHIDGVLFLLGGNNILFLEHVLKTNATPELVIPPIQQTLQSVVEELPNAEIYIANYPVPHAIPRNTFAALEKFRKSPPFGIGGPDLSTPIAYKPEFFQEDLLHLNAKGHSQMAEIWETFLRKRGYR
jgi:lysophospholipase L1-like esterase